MKRKVIQLAGKTLVVSLPSKWASKYKIKKGDEIEAEEAENRLVISQNNELISAVNSVDISGTHPMIKRILGAIYKTGYDEVEVKFETPKDLEVALDVVREEFIGFEVVKISKSSLYVKNVATIQYAEFENILRRIFLIIISMAEEGLEAVKKNDETLIKSVIFMDKDINKYADFCRRILNKKGYVQFRKTPPLYYIVEQLEKIADSFRDLCQYALESKTKPSPEITELYKNAGSYFREFYELYYKFNIKKIADFGKNRYELKEKTLFMLKNCKKQELPFVLHLFIVIENCFDMNGPLMAINL